LPAGQGSQRGAHFGEIAIIVIDHSRFADRLGACFDSCQAFAAGYDLRSAEGYAHTFAAFDREIGLERLRFFRLNDSKKGLGSRVDRHAHIGDGQVGREGFRLPLNDARFAHHAMALETPQGQGLLAASGESRGSLFAPCPCNTRFGTAWDPAPVQKM
jgi:deoxyribonuclease-4